MKTANKIKKHKLENNTFFSKWAKLYDYNKYILSHLRKKATDLLDLNKPQKILDVSTGTGDQAVEFAKQGHKVIGIDISPDMLAFAQKKKQNFPNLQLFQSDATSLPFKNNSFDTTSISFALHDMPYEIELQTLREIKRVTKPDGKIVIVEYNEPRNHLIAKLAKPIIEKYDTKHYKPFVQRGILSLLNVAGFKIAKQQNALGLFQIVLARNKKLD